jgi:hypothetical protein
LPSTSMTTFLAKRSSPSEERVSQKGALSRHRRWASARAAMRAKPSSHCERELRFTAQRHTGIPIPLRAYDE